MEATEISVLMLITCVSGTLLYSRDSPMGSLAFSRALRSLLMGTAVAVAAFLIITSLLGRRSGAHMNPAITASYFWLGRVHRWDAVQYLITVPGMYGNPAAMLAEFGLSAVLFGVVLYASNHRFLFRFTPVFVAVLTVLYYGISSSLAGYSVNPARSFASALFAWVWRGIWIYFIAPVLGMLAAATIYVRIMGPNSVYCAKIFHDLRSTCPFPCHFVHLYRQGDRRLR